MKSLKILIVIILVLSSWKLHAQCTQPRSILFEGLVTCSVPGFPANSVIIYSRESDIGVNYQLRKDGLDVGSPMPGTGNFIPSGRDLQWTVTQSGTYNVTATVVSTGCTRLLDRTLVLDLEPRSNSFSISGASYVCSAPIAISLSGSELNTQYSLLRDGQLVSNLNGTGGPLVWNSSSAGIYTITGFKLFQQGSAGCPNTSFSMIGSLTVSQGVIPTTYTLSALSNTVCANGSLVLSLNSSQSGVSYQLMRDGNPVGTPINGSGSKLSFPGQSASGNYTARATHLATTCQADMFGNVTVSVNPLPIQFVTSGGGPICAGTSTSISLGGSEIGVNYQLKRDGSNVGAAKAGTGAGLVWTGQSTAGTYTILGTISTSGCSQLMSSSASISINVLPTLNTTGGGGSFCSGGAGLPVTLSGSQVGINYQLKRGTTNVGTPLAGTGSLLTFPNQTTAGTYTVVGTNATTGCLKTMTGSAVIVVNALPTLYTVGGGGAYCAGGVGLSITLSNSQAGVNYQLLNGGSPVGSPKPGLPGLLTWASNTAAGTYTITAVNATTGCTRAMTGSKVITINPLPNLFTVGAGGLYCPAGNVPVTLSGSQTGVNYQLKNNGVNSGAVKAGTGSALTWTALTAAGNYTILATNATTTCNQVMTGSVNIAPMAAYAFSGGGLYPGTGPGFTLTLSNSQVGASYQLKRNGTNTGAPVLGTGLPLTWVNRTATGSYTVVGTSVAGCVLSMTGTAVIELGLVPDAIEFAALKDLYLATAGASWADKTNWPTTWPASASSTQFGTWFGITVLNGDVSAIDLYGNNLTGLLPPTIGNLQQLTSVRLGDTGITGTMPSFFGSLIKLQNLVIQSTQLTGQIPPSFGNLINLKELALAENQLTGAIPAELGNLLGLETLILDGNQLSGSIPVSMGNLSMLKFLYIINNQLTGSIPASLGNLSLLESLNLSINQLTGSIPLSLGNLTSLQEMNLQGNQLSGQIPSSLRNLGNLRFLFLSENQLSGGIPSELVSLSNLEQIIIGQNQLTGTLPTWIENLPQLTYFDAANNQLIGDIPSSFGTLSQLISLSLSDNRLSGAVPSFLANMSSLQNLSLQDNDFTSLPDFSQGPNPQTLGLLVAGNRISFESIEPNLNPAGGTDLAVFDFSPQKNISDLTELAVGEGSRLEIPARSLTSNTTIVWEKRNGSTWTDVSSGNQNATGSSFVVNSAAPGDAGTYRYRMSNAFVSAVSPLTITSDPITVTVTDPVNNPITYRVKALYNGTITASAWRTDPAYATSNTEQKGIYLYSYDDKYQFKEAQFAEPNFTLNTFALAGNKFREYGYAYDANGNILSLKRYNENGGRIHDLSYSYEANKNKLVSVTNASMSFRNYSYNDLGQMQGEVAADEENKFVVYDVTGKVVRVYGPQPISGPGGGGDPGGNPPGDPGPPNPDGGSAQVPTPSGPPNQYGDVIPPNYTLRTDYVYDDRGFRLAKKTFDETGTLVFTTWYVRDASGNVLSIYEEKATAPAVLTRTETPVYGSGKLGLYRQKLDGGYEYVYEMTDHLGNVRATLKQDETIYLATLEDTGSPDWSNPRLREMQYFKNLFETEQRDSRMNKSAPTAEVPSPAYSAYLNWTDDGNPTTRENVIGPAIGLKVEAGDELNLETWAKFERKVSYSRNTTTGMMASLLASSFVNPGLGLESLGQAAQDFTNGLPGVLANTGADPPDKPYAYLNYVVFDRNYLQLDGGAVRVPATAGFDPGLEIAVQPQQVAFSSPISISQSGYIYVWVSNESQATKVWFDDLKVTHRGSRVTQATDYYAFGSVMREQKTEDDAKYRYGYQGQFSEKDEETGWNHFVAREFEATIGRWTSRDRAGQFYSPFVGYGNNPICSADPSGHWAILLNRSFMAQFYGKIEYTESIGLIKNEQTGDFSLVKYTTVAPGFGYGIGAGAGPAIALFPNVNNGDQLTGKGFNIGVHGGFLGSVSGELSFPQDRGGSNDYNQVFGDTYAGGSLGIGIGIGGGYYTDISFTRKDWELKGNDFENYIQNPEAAVRDYLNYILNKSVELQHRQIQRSVPQQIRNMVKAPTITVGNILSGQELVNWERSGN